MVCGVLCSRFVCLDTQMRVHKVLIVDYCIGGKLSLSLPEKNLFVVQGGRRLTEISRSRNRLWRFRGRHKTRMNRAEADPLRGTCPYTHFMSKSASNSERTASASSSV